MKKTSLLFCTCALLSLLFSCNKKECTQGISSGEAISFHSQVGAILNNTATKTEEVVSLSEFHVTAVTEADGRLVPSWENVVFTKDGDLYTSTKLWPAEDPHYEFLASNAVITHQDGAFLIHANPQVDIVVAYNDDVQYKETNDLTFKHIYARMDFKPIHVPDGYTVSDISLSFQPRTSGIYNLLEGHNRHDGSGWSHVQTEEQVTVTSEDGIHFQTEGGRQDFYVVPGEYLLSASWTIRKDDFTLSFADESFSVDLTGGFRNSVQISVFGMPTAEKAIAFNVAVEPWDERVIDAREVNPRITLAPDELSFGPKGGTLPVQMNRVTGGVSRYEYSLDGGTTWTEGLPAELDFAFSTDEASFSVSMAAADGPSTITDVVWPSESRFNTERGTESAPIDLSLEDVRGDANTDGRSTANCYVIHAPGWYMFPLVYGNAITDGVEQQNPGQDQPITVAIIIRTPSGKRLNRHG
ncbi:MAG: fimbrillin family protein [Bacteroidales bacterium]|nr:fimbrillin family protein [Bacteroidales bacterium]